MGTIRDNVREKWESRMNLVKSNLEYNEDARAIATAEAMKHYYLLNGKAPKNPLMIVINMKEPSYRKRLYLYDIVTQKYLTNHHVAHGSGSANPADKAYAVSFSNTPESHKSSKGAMITGNTYVGKHGRSCRLHGLEPEINDNVDARDIVIHAADYMTDDFILANNRAGCSWGCFALDPHIAQGFIDLVKGGTYLYVYA